MVLETEDTINVGKEFPTAIKAQRRGNNTLILRSIKPFKRMDGKMAVYSLEYRWHRPGGDVHSVLGHEFSYWKKNELNWKECLFGQVNLF